MLKCGEMVHKTFLGAEIEEPNANVIDYKVHKDLDRADCEEIPPRCDEALEKEFWADSGGREGDVCAVRLMTGDVICATSLTEVEAPDRVHRIKT